ncbi:MAG TPA: hypothetical protein VLZ83_13330 [Edaphocola sp.]|nr:hypothetical protein [Edaphocola sp.]
MKLFKFSSFSIVLLLTIVFFSCQKRALRIDLSNIVNCHQNNPHDSLDIIQQLNNATWQLFTHQGFDEKSENMKNRNILLNITNGYFTISENGFQLFAGPFAIERNQDDPSYFQIVKNETSYMGGKIIICNDQLLFHDSYRDADDNLFKKLK